MVLSIYDWVYGTSLIAGVFLSIVAGIVALTLFRISFQRLEFHAWRFLIFTLMLFAVQEVLGALKVFQIYVTPHLTHVFPGFILGTLIAALVNQIYINKGYK